MWVVNKKTGVKFEQTEDYYNKYFLKDANMEKLAEKPTAKKELSEPEKKTRKSLVADAKKQGVKGADRMSLEDLTAVAEGE